MVSVRRRAAIAAALLALVLVSTSVHAIPGRGSKDEEKGAPPGEEAAKNDEAKQAYDRGMELVKEERYREALDRFRAASKKDKHNHEYLNMVAYTLRKTGNLDEAFKTYAKVLEMKPDYAPAREYLGEAHLQAVLLELDVLRGYGEAGREEYEDLAAALREAISALDAEPTSTGTPAPDKKGW